MNALFVALLLAFTFSFAMLAYHTIQANRYRRKYLESLKEIQDELKKNDAYLVDESAGNG